MDDEHIGEDEEEECSSSSSSSSDVFGWPLRKERSISFASTKSISSSIAPDENPKNNVWDEKRDKRETSLSEVELMKERFAKLLLGEDMSGGSRGVCTALTISNAITNLAASVFGELWRLEPLSTERKIMWRREMEWLLSVSDYIVELVPSWQSFRDGSNMEIMVSKPRSDIHINLPALRKLDTMLLESLDGYKETEFWYVEQGIFLSDSRKKHVGVQRQEEKWWLPIPRVPPNGMSDQARKCLQNQRDCTNQILKAAMAINSQVLSEMEVPELFWETLPKNGKACLGEILYRGLTVENFSLDNLVSQLDLSTEHSVLEIVNKVEAAIHIWKRKLQQPQKNHQNQHQVHQIQNAQEVPPKVTVHSKNSSHKSSWGKVKDHLVTDIDRVTLLGRVETLLLCLKQKYPGLPQTALDTNKIQYNRDVGQSILESYSRVLESLAFNILARIDDVMFIDDSTTRDHKTKSAYVSTVVKTSASSETTTVTTTTTTTKRRLPSPTPYATPNSSPEKSHRNASVDPGLSHISEESSPACVDKADAYSHARKLETSRKLVSPPSRD